MWKLDLLEAKFEDVPPRYPHTKKLLFALNHKNKLAKKLPTNKQEAQAEIKTLKTRYFEQKYHSAYIKLEKETKRYAKQKKAPDVFNQNDFISQLITAKLIKCITSTILLTKHLKTNPPAYIPENISKYILDKSSPFNPSHFFVQYCQSSKEVNNYCSNLWNSKAVKSVVDDIEWSFRMVRGNLSKQEFEERRKQKGRAANEDDSNAGDNTSDETSEESGGELSDEDQIAAFDGMVAGSDQEEEDDDEEKENGLDPNIDYNEVTDEEPSEAASGESSHDSGSEIDLGDDFFEEEPPKKKSKANPDYKYNLPELAQGYYSGGSDDESDDIDNDDVVKSITQQRKNRRGQRARQKIWAQKYGKEAKHIVKNIERIQSERETRQREYEERQRKRELKAKLLAEKQQPTGANTEPLGERKSKALVTPPPAEEKKIHPSWEAKKLAEEKLKNVKFQGKKITFD